MMRFGRVSAAFDPCSVLPRLLCLAGAVLCALAVRAEPYTPGADSQVLERVTPRSGNPRARELQALRAASQGDPHNVQAAVALARRYFDEAQAEGDPRYVGYAQAALAPWWNETAPPPEVRVQRAVLRQYGHAFVEALNDLDAVVAGDPQQGEAWAWKAAIHMVRAEYPAARQACEALEPMASDLIGVACLAYVDSLTGHAASAASALRSANASAPTAAADEKLWALTRLAEIDERRGDLLAAEQAFRAALALQQPDVYLLAAFADYLLDRDRASEVLTLLNGRERADVLLLRLALAAHLAHDARARAWSDDLEARFDAARARGDSTHEKEESRYRLALRGDAPGALALARANYAKQREPADARVLLEAALAARSREAALPVLQWLDANRTEGATLHALAERAKALR
jgi:hypothetical protein